MMQSNLRIDKGESAVVASGGLPISKIPQRSGIAARQGAIDLVRTMGWNESQEKESWP
jgi:hypothetical protein